MNDLPRIPTDSTDAAEMRALAAEAEFDQALEDRRHTKRCRNGWLGEDPDGRPIPCLRCRPHLLTGSCRCCGTKHLECLHQTAQGRGRCCSECDHRRSTTTEGTAADVPTH